MRKRVVAIDGKEIGAFSQAEIDEITMKYDVRCIAHPGILINRNVKLVTEKPSAFVTLRANSYTFNGNVQALANYIMETDAEFIAFDFDGVINSYVSGWQGANIVNDKPVEGIMYLIRQLMDEGKDVVVYSSRCSKEEGIIAMRNYLFAQGNISAIKFVTELDSKYLLVDDRVIDYTKINNEDIISCLDSFDSWVNKIKKQEVR